MITKNSDNNTCVYKFLRFFWRRLYPLFFVKTLFFDNDKFLRGQWKNQIKNIQLDRTRPQFLDRQIEIASFYKLSGWSLLIYYIRYGTPNSYRFKKRLNNFFEGNTSNQRLKQSYEKSALHYSLRLMLAYERYSMIADYLSYLQNTVNKSINSWKICDYGCGVGDVGLLLASLGAQVTLCELDDKKLDFVEWRFKKRGYNPKIIRITNTEEYPDLPVGEHDLIIATEIFEHVRDPLKLLEIFTNSLKNGGYLFDSMGGKFERIIEGDHLREAIETGNSIEFKNYYQANYQKIYISEGLECLFKKK